MTLDPFQNDRMRSRSWVAHPYTTIYSQMRRPPTPPNMMNQSGTERPTLARFTDSLLYPTNKIDDDIRTITIPRVLEQGKTPQNTSIGVGKKSSSGSSTTSNVPSVTLGSQPRTPVVMYTELQFPPNTSGIQHPVFKKDSNSSNITQRKVSSESNRFQQSIVQSNRDIFNTKDEKIEAGQYGISPLM